MKRRDVVAAAAAWWCACCAQAQLSDRARVSNPNLGSLVVTPHSSRASDAFTDRPPPRLDLGPQGTGPLVAASNSWCGSAADPAPGAIRTRAYGLKENAWRNKSDFTWSCQGVPPGLAGGQAEFVRLAAIAFNMWGREVPLIRFRRSTSDADISIGVGPLGGSLALASGDGRQITVSNGMALGLPIVWMASENVLPPIPAGSYPLLPVLIHEIGHALGLLHSTRPEAIMFPTANMSTQTWLADEDRRAIRALYGWRPQTPLPFGTEQAPTLTACGPTLAMAWRGQGSDRRIWLATSTNGDAWSGQHLAVGGPQTIGSPALAWNGSVLLMAWRGGANDERLYVSSSRDFFRQSYFPHIALRAASSHGPRMAMIKGVPVMVWKGMGSDQGIYLSRLVNGAWTEQMKIPNVATAAAPSICEDFDGGIRLLWRGIEGDETLWTTSGTPDGRQFQPQRSLQWPILGIGSPVPTAWGTGMSRSGPVLCNGVTDGEAGIFAVWLGRGREQSLWFTQLRLEPNGTPVWSTQARIPNIGSSQPAGAAYFNRSLVVAWKGVEGDRRMYSLRA
jgi:hypothetical protein